MSFPKMGIVIFCIIPLQISILTQNYALKVIITPRMLH